MKTPMEYRRLIHECHNVAGADGQFWNERFLSALDKRGLTLGAARPPHDQDEWYPDGYPFAAPLPYDGPGGWPWKALILWKAETETDHLFEMAQVVRLEPGDVVLVTIKKELSRETCEAWKAHLKAFLPKNEVAVLSGDVRINFLKQS